MVCTSAALEPRKTGNSAPVAGSETLRNRYHVRFTEQEYLCWALGAADVRLDRARSGFHAGGTSHLKAGI